MKTSISFALLVLLAWPAGTGAAQDNVGAWRFSPRLEGSSNPSGTVIRFDPDASYGLSEHINAYAGLPVFFVRPSDRLEPEGTRSFRNGFGDLYLGLEIPVEGETANYQSDVRFTLPTGQEDHGLSRGEITVHWTNEFSRSFGPVTPYGSIGVGNTIRDKASFIRPFTSRGMVSQFEGGALLGVLPLLDLGGSFYSVRASGEQTVFSRVLDSPFAPGLIPPGLGREGRVFETSTESRVPAELLHDHGFATWVGLQPESRFGFQLGYGRSVGYDLDSVFFGVGLDLGPIRP